MCFINLQNIAGFFLPSSTLKVTRSELFAHDMGPGVGIPHWKRLMLRVLEGACWRKNLRDESVYHWEHLLGRWSTTWSMAVGNSVNWIALRDVRANMSFLGFTCQSFVFKTVTSDAMYRSCGTYQVDLTESVNRLRQGHSSRSNGPTFISFIKHKEFSSPRF